MDMIGWMGTDDWQPCRPEDRVFLLRDTLDWSIEERLGIMGLGPRAWPQDIAFARRLLHGPHGRIVRRRAIAAAEAEARKWWHDSFRWDNLGWPN